MDQDIISLLSKYMNKQCSRAELGQVMSIIEKGTFHEEWEYALTEDANFVVTTTEHSLMSESSALYLHDRIMITVNEETPAVLRPATSLPWKLISFAAAAVLLLLSGWWFFKDQNRGSNAAKEQITYQNDIAPGKSGAILRLEGGKEITLNSSKSGLVIKSNALSYNDGTELKAATSASKTELYSASTGIGSMYMLTLPDGTQVWLNAASQLDFPSRFNGNTRRVSLKGEAYFQVAKDKLHPFMVESRGMQVKVLGTHFNINSYPDEKTTKTTLLEGSVQLLPSSLQGGSSTETILKPGQQATLAANGTLSVSQVDTTQAMAWKNNKFIFENNDIKSVMRMVQRWYNVEVIYSGPVPDAAFGGKVSRFGNVSNVLRVLETTGGAHFKIEGRKIYVSQ